MRVLSALLFVFVSSYCFAQDVTKERLVGWSIYNNSTRTDSASLFYPSRAVGDDYSSVFIQGTQQFLESKIDSIQYYDELDKLRQRKSIRRDSIKKEMLIQSLFFDQQSESWKKTEIESVSYLPNFNTKLSHLIKNTWFTDTLINFFEHNFLFSESGQKIADTVRRYNTVTDSYIKSIHNYYYYSNGKIRKSTTRTFDNTTNRILSYREDSTSVNLSFTESYNLDSSNNRKNHIRKIVIRNNTNNLIKNINLENKIGVWDTTLLSEQSLTDSFSIVSKKNYSTLINKSYYFNQNLRDSSTYFESLRIDSTNNDDKSVLQIVFTRNDQNTPLVRLTKKISKYSNADVHFRQQYEWDSSAWKLNYEWSFKFNANENSHSTYTYRANNSRTDYSLDKTYINSAGNPIKQQSYTSVDDSLNFVLINEYNYYYEKYAEEKTLLNYDELSPISYPNPFTKNVSILFSCVPNKAGTITISNLQGEVMERHNFSSHIELYQYNWNASGLPKGIYLARIVMGKEVSTIKLLKE